MNKKQYITNLKLIQNSKLIEEMGFRVRLIEEETNRVKNPIIIDTKNNDRLIVTRYVDNNIVVAHTNDKRQISINLDSANIRLLQILPNRHTLIGFNQKLTPTSDTISLIKNYLGSKDHWKEDLIIINNYRNRGENDHVIESLLDMPSDIWGNDNVKKEIIGTTKIVVGPRNLLQRNLVGKENGFVQVFPDRIIFATQNGYKGSYDTIRTISKEYKMESTDKITETTYKLCKSILPKENYEQLGILKSTLKSDYDKMLIYSKSIK